MAQHKPLAHGEPDKPGQGHNWDAWTAQMRNALPMLLNSVSG
ncbi:hypothetical protein [Nocardia wallacei]|nr:hypothetical protein [Nocardia wallacei]